MVEETDGKIVVKAVNAKEGGDIIYEGPVADFAKGIETGEYERLLRPNARFDVMVLSGAGVKESQERYFSDELRVWVKQYART